VIAIPQLVVAWLNSIEGISTLTEGRISTILVPGEGFPAIVVGPVSGGPATTPSHSVDRVENWNVALYAVAGRRAGGQDDLPDNEAAWALAQEIVNALASLDENHYITTAANLVAGRVVSATPSVDASGNFARVLVNAGLQVWNRA